MKRSVQPAILLFLLLALPARADEGARVVVYDGYGTPTALRISGRALEGSPPPAPNGEEGILSNLADNVEALESDEIVGTLVRVEVRGLTFETRTDRDGLWEVRVAGLPAMEREGPIEVRASLMEIKAARAGRGQVWIHEPGEIPCVVSDVDDTIVRSKITNGAAMIWHALTVNAAQKQAVPGIAEAYRRAHEAGAGAFFYISGSPQNFYGRIRQFQVINELPLGPMLLKNFGSDPIFDQMSYKLGHLRELFSFYDNLRCVLVGDSGEVDAEVYKKIREEFPEQVHGIVIRQVPGSELTSERAAGVVTVRDFRENPDVIAGLLNSK